MACSDLHYTGDPDCAEKVRFEEGLRQLYALRSEPAICLRGLRGKCADERKESKIRGDLGFFYAKGGIRTHGRLLAEHTISSRAP